MGALLERRSNPAKMRTQSQHITVSCFILLPPDQTDQSQQRPKKNVDCMGSSLLTMAVVTNCVAQSSEICLPFDFSSFLFGI